ncbi:MAG TPA: GtrA family protein [Chloroflexota bacterium]|nr:GtrA family protein [Chloroflexota bacterium]
MLASHAIAATFESFIAFPTRLPRPLRFAFTGGAAAVGQLALLHALAPSRIPPIAANTIAFLVAAQLNFALSCVFTWWDRFSASPRVLAARWLAFHASISATAMLNLAVFGLVALAAPPLVAAVAGIGAAAAVNFATGDRLVFRART